MTPEETNFITLLRLRSAPGSDNPPTLDEMKRAILILRGNRRLAAEANAASGTSKSRSKKPTAEEIASALDELDAL